VSAREGQQLVDEQCTVSHSLAGMRLDQAAAILLPAYSRTQLATWIRAGQLTVDGCARPPKHRVLGGETLHVAATIADASGRMAAQPVGFAIVFEDADLIVVDKPAGLVVHPGAGNPDQTLVNGLLAHRPALAALPRAGLVHRLDKDTSGLMLIAATPQAFRLLTAAIAERQIERRYCAVVEGVLTGGRDIEAPLGRDPNNRLRQRVLEDGRYALTHVRVRERFRAHTLIGAELATGRTHQIRVHLSSIGYPLLGDRRYGARGRLPTRPAAALVDVVRAFRRQALHAEGLCFTHPSSAAALAFEAPLPRDFARLLECLREDRDDGDE
jgi:23S rRNA pseudouridine1911/1915/1917 synthase